MARRHARGSAQVGRKAGRAPARRAVLVVAYDGERTEDDYFRNWAQVIGPAGVTLEPVLVRSGGNVLKALKAALRKRGNTAADEFWCVFDVDDSPLEAVRDAIALAERSGVRLCLSVRSFEVWLALHFERFARPVISEVEAVALVRRHVGGYGARNKLAPFGQLFPLSAAACDNADWLRDQGCANPATGVDELVRRLLQRLEEAKARHG